MSIDVEKELGEANARLPVVIDGQMPLEFQVRSIALTIAQRHCGDTVIKDGVMYQQYKMEGRNMKALDYGDVLKMAIIFERYLYGEFSKGVMENALRATSTDFADMMEDECRKREKGDTPEEPNTSAAPSDTP
jgi:hypothetical protein